MTERNFNVAHNEELTPSVQPVKTFSGASHKTLARYVNDTESTMTQSLNVSIACQRFQLAGIIVLADGENFSSTNLTATAYKNHENRKYQLATETISLPATNAGNMGYVAATMSGYEDFVDSIAFSGTISIAAGGSVTIIALFKGGEDSALSELVSKIDEIAENTSIQEPYRLLEVVDGAMTGSRTSKKKIDLCGATDVVAGVFGGYATNNTEIEGAIDLSSLVTVSGQSAFQNAFRYCTGLSSIDLSSLETVSALYAFYNAFRNCTGLSSVDLSALKTVSGENSFNSAFNGCTNLSSIDLSSLETVSALYAVRYAFENCTGLSSVDLSALKTVSGGSAFNSAFNGCTNLSSIDLSSLETVSGSYAFYYAFQGCTSLEDIYFNSLKTTSFGSNTNQFSGMLAATTDVKLHFPSNLTATIAGLNGYPNFGGTNTQVLFDLPATE